MASRTQKQDNSQPKQILDILNRYERLIDQANKDDCEVNLGGNGINCCEADSTFRPLAKEIRGVLLAVVEPASKLTDQARAKAAGLKVARKKEIGL